MSKCWCIPAKANAEFVTAMESLLEVYHRDFDDDEVLVTMDETSKQQTRDVCTPRPVKPGPPATYDYESERNGVANIFMLFAPLLGWRPVSVTDQQTMIDRAHLIRDLVDIHFPDQRIILAMDNLNTHRLTSLYAAFEPEEARRIAARLEIHYTPRHGSWLNMAEIEIGVPSRQCLSRRIPDRETMCREYYTWQDRRNLAEAKVSWRFTTSDARIK